LCRVNIITFIGVINVFGSNNLVAPNLGEDAVDDGETLLCLAFDWSGKVFAV